MRKILKILPMIVCFLMIVIVFLLFGAQRGFCYVTLIDQGFEYGLSEWQSLGGLGVVVNSNNPHSGFFSADLAGGPYQQNQLQPMGKAILQLKHPLDLSGYSAINASFWYNFYTYDAMAYDNFSVDVKGSDGSNINLVSWGGLNYPGLETTGWTNWNTGGWVSMSYAPGVNYNLVFSLDTLTPPADRNYPSWGYVDDIKVAGMPIPEPGSMMLLGTGLIGLVAGRKKIMKHNK